MLDFMPSQGRASQSDEVIVVVDVELCVNDKEGFRRAISFCRFFGSASLDWLLLFFFFLFLGYFFYALR